MKLVLDKRISLFLVLCLLVSALITSVAATEVTILDGYIKVSDTANNVSVNGTTVTATAAAKKGSGSSASNTLTITNNTDSVAAVYFKWSIAKNSTTGSMSVEVDGNTSNSGTFSKNMGIGDTITIKVSAGGNFLTASTTTLTLSDFSYSAIGSTYDVTVNSTGSGAVTLDGATITSGTTYEVSATSGGTLAATPSSGYTFLGWVNTANHAILSTSTSYTITPTADMNVQAVFVNSTSDTAWFNVDNKYLTSNLTTASSLGTKIVLANNGTLAGEHTIASGDTLLIPYNDAYTVCTTKPTSHDDAYTAPSVFRTLTMASGANITVNGTLSVSGSQSSKYAYNGMPSGPLGFIAMKTGSAITVENGGALYAWGYITGSGSVAVKSGGTIYECFQVSDYRGGDATSTIVGSDDEYGVFPFNQYYIQNVEVPLTLYAGAVEKGFMAVSVTLAGTQTSEVPIFGSSNSMFTINSGYVVKDYIEGTGRTNYRLCGETVISPISISIKVAFLGKSITIDSSKYALPIPQHMTVTVESGNLSVNQSVALLPGSELYVNQGAKCTLASGKYVYIYDLDQWIYNDGANGYSGTTNLPYINIPYVPGGNGTTGRLKDGLAEINGEVDATASGIYVTTNGANIYSTGSGVLKQPSLTDGTIRQVITNDTDIGSWPEISIISAQLLNSDGTYLATANSNTTPNTYTYSDGKWICETHADEDNDSTCDVCGYVLCTHENTELQGKKDATCTEDGYTGDTVCLGCGKTIETGTTIESTGSHDYETVTTPATCTEDGATVYTCSACGDTYSEVITAPGHDYGNVTYTWTGYTSCVASHTCQVATCGYEETVTAEGNAITSEVTTPETCKTTGVRTYTANFGVDWAGTDQETEEILVDEGAHVWGNTEYNWEEDGSACSAKRVCQVSGCGLEESATAEGDAIASEVKIPANCTVMGTTTYTATFAESWAATPHPQDVQDIPTDSSVHADTNKDHDCDYGCQVFQGTCADTNTDHACDYGAGIEGGCDAYHGTHEDTNLDHACDYGCKVAIGTCADNNKDHKCDHSNGAEGGCQVNFGSCVDNNKDHICDYSLGAEGGCDKFFGECADGDFDHYCDYGAGTEGGCKKYYGTHEDTDLNHVCDYGCAEAIGICKDANLDHACDYGCDKVFGTCADANKDHICDYSLGAEGGCDKVFGEHEDGDKNHTCDYGCTEAIGDCSDSETDKDHVCDYGCGNVWNDCTDAEADGDHDCDVCGKENVTVCADGDDNHKCDDCGTTTSACKDDNKDHICDYAGCKATGMGDCVDGNQDHYCDYGAESATGCREYHGTHADANKDHTCDYGCSTAIGTCEDADKDHYCDYGAESESGCRDSFGEHADTTGDQDHTCDYCESEEILSNCTGAAAVTENDVVATCEEAGSYDTVVYCSECGDELSRTTTTVPATGHASVTDKAVDPTCTETGLTEGSHCSVCGEILVAQEVVDALGHDYDAVVTAPTCTAAGYTTYTCSVCDDTYVADETAALGHNYDAVVKEPTCTEGGYTTYTCTVCDDTYVADETEAKGHDYDAVITAPTCTEVGYTTYTCKASDHTYIADETAALGHNYDKGVVTTAPQCEATGIKTFTCTVCGDFYTEIVDATGHTEVADEAVAPTCTETGLTAGSHCSVCGETIVEQDVVGALGHTDVIDEAVAPTCTETGLSAGTHCSVCGEITQAQTVTPATGHDWEAGECVVCHVSSENLCEHTYEVTETHDATCTADGYKVETCTICEHSKTTVTVEATGHSWTDADCTTAKTCSVCDETDGDPLGHNYVAKVTAPTCTAVGYTTYTCSVCGDTYTANETPANGHSPAEAVRENEVAATCNTDGSYESVVYCSVCSTQISRDTIVVPAHGNHTEGTPVVENEKAATCTGSGSYDTVVYCSVCNTQMSRNTSTVAALGHTEVADAAVAATCTTAGKTAGSHCSVCGEVVTAQTVIEALGHDETTHEAKAATCTEVGWNTYVTCSRCGNSTYAEIPALGHDYAANVQAPTCTEDGHTTYTCSNCGDSYIADEVAANGHRYTEVVHAPTCTEAGYTAHNCSSCGDSYSTDEVPALGHTEVTTIERWTSDGVSYYQTVVTCETCKTELRSTTVAQEVFTDAAIPETIKEDYPTADALKDALKDGALTKHDNFFTEHKLDKKNAVTELYDVALKVQDETGNWNDVTADEFPAEGITVKMPIPEGTTLKNYTFFVAHIFTADINGYKAGDIEYPEVTELEEDGISYIVFHVNGLSPITMTYVQDCTEGHTYETNVTAPTCTEAGFTTYTCSVCGDSYVDGETEALGHDYVETVTPATCTEDGAKTYTCSSCGDSYSEAIPATGHNYVDGVCACGEKEACEHTGGTADCQNLAVCELCGEEYGELGDHIPGEAVVENIVKGNNSTGVMPQYDSVTYCSACGEETRETVVLSQNVFAGMTMKLEYSLEVNFGVNTALLDSSEHYAIITRKYSDGTADDVVRRDQSEWIVYSGKVYAFPYAGINGYEMIDKFYIVLYNGSDEIVGVYEDSVRDYSMRMLSNTSKDLQYRRMFVDMLNYGATAQTRFGYATDNLANNLLTDEHKSFATPDVTTSNNRVMDDKFGGTSLMIQNKIKFNFMFLKSGVTSDMYAVITYTSSDGTVIPAIRYDYSDFQTYNSSYWYVTLDGISVKDGYEMVTCTLYNADGTVYGSMMDSMTSYLVRNISKDTIFPAILKFIDSTSKYFS